MNEGQEQTQQLKHTPGPWIAGTYTTTEEFRAIDEHISVGRYHPHATRGLLIATLGPAGDAQSLADAAIIAAAPQLLKVMKHAIEVILEENDQLNGEMFSLMAEMLNIVDEVEPGYSEALDRDAS